MDTTMIGALLKAYGAPNTPENINALTQRYASDPTAAERKINGLQGQSDESGGSRDAILNMMIDKTLQDAVPQGEVTVGAPVMESVANSSVPTRRSATAGAPLSKEVPGAATYDSRNLGPLPPRDGAAPMTSGYEVDPQQSAQGPQGSGWDWLLPLLGIAAGAKAIGGPAAPPPAVKSGLPVNAPIPEAEFAGPMNKNVTPYPYGRTKTDRVADDTGKTAIPEGQRGVNSDVGSTLLTDVKKLDNQAPSTVTGSPENEVLARKAQTQAELDAANNEGNNIQKQLLEKNKRKGWKPEMAKRAFGRK